MLISAGVVVLAKGPLPHRPSASTGLKGLTMRPTIYGYMRVATADDGDEVERIRRELTEYAEREGFTLDQVFTEQIQCSESAFYTLLDTLKRSDVRNVIVPSLWHFARLPGLQEAMKTHIEQETGATIWVVQGQRR
ncbi:recombinase family protein [Frankia sp. CiP3]|uniref:recombinase family protein n=1 Tax=Frankia sp. CiP3 TaxID=2880971 RepID=UPI001EF619EB|nr:recombinase family protein [Frankia sp. CiP3]